MMATGRRLLRTWRAAGPGAPLALLLAALAALLLGVTVPDWRQHAADLQQQADRRQQLARQQAARPVARPVWPAAVLLPLPDQAGERLAALLQLARQQGVQVQQLDQRLLQADGQAAARLVLTMPALASYASLRRCIEAALAADPALSLDRLRLARSDPAGERLAADLVWSLHQQRLPQGPSASPVPGVAPAELSAEVPAGMPAGVRTAVRAGVPTGSPSPKPATMAGVLPDRAQGRLP